MSFHNVESVLIDRCIQKLSELHGGKVTLRSKQLVGGGCINHAVRLSCNSGEYFLKWNASCPADLFEQEAAGLIEMNSDDVSELLIPKVFWARPADELPGLILMEYLQPASGSLHMDEQLGRGLAQLHQKTYSHFGFHQQNYCGLTPQNNTWRNQWAVFFAENRIAWLLQLIRQSRKFTSDHEKLFEQLFKRLPQILCHEPRPALIHGDLWSGNFLYCSNGPALIDPACSYSDAEMELSMMQLFGGFSPRVWAAYHEALPPKHGWQERVRLYSIYHLLNHYYLFGGSYLEQTIGVVRTFL